MNGIIGVPYVDSRKTLNDITLAKTLQVFQKTFWPILFSWLNSGLYHGSIPP